MANEDTPWEDLWWNVSIPHLFNVLSFDLTCLKGEHLESEDLYPGCTQLLIMTVEQLFKSQEGHLPCLAILLKNLQFQKYIVCIIVNDHPISTWLVFCTMDLTPFIWHGVVWTSWRHAFIGVCNGHFYLPPSHHIYTWWSRINYWDQVILPSTSPLTSQIPLMWCTKWWMILKICGRTVSVSSQVLSHWTLSLACSSLWTRRNWHATSSLTWTLVFLQSIVTWVLLCINITWCHRSICRLLTRPLQYWLECVVSCLQHWDSLLWVLVLLQSDSRPHLDASQGVDFLDVKIVCTASLPSTRVDVLQHGGCTLCNSYKDAVFIILYEPWVHQISLDEYNEGDPHNSQLP